ncbi:MAG: hypothetical protein EP315_01105 [Gammaproteobacteria bacterium]|nr:MAG: hypothetical protein EP315_01105 [Gammaproteobacteria bacterium]
MHISTLYVLLAAEVIFILSIIAVTLGIYVIRLRKQLKNAPVETANEDNTITAGKSYSEYLLQELERNQTKTRQQQNIENDQPSESETADNTARHSVLLQAREMFLNNEKSAAELTENENLFWDQVYAGMKDILETCKVVEHETHVVTEEMVAHKTTTKEKVFYIETMGKKVDGEVNKLKDIIYEQENTLNSLKKALARSVEHEEEESEEITELRTYIESFERQLNDSKMCMEVLELENERLQHELNELESKQPATDAIEQTDTETSSSMFDLAQMREVLENQEKQILELNQAIDDLKLEADQAERLKQTIKDFTRTSQEMMGCITILEEENEHLKQHVHHLADNGEAGTDGDNEAIEEYRKKLKELEQEIIKKDVAFAKLQDEFSSMEQEYLAMYHAMHGEQQ